MVAVVHLINSFHVGGSERQAVQLVRLLREHSDHDVTLACLDRTGCLRDASGVARQEILEYPLTSLHDLNAAKQLRRLAADLRDRDVSVLQTHDVYSNIFGLTAARLARTPARIGARRDTGGVGSTANRRVEAICYRSATRIVVNADAVRRDLVRQGVTASKVVVIPNGIDADRATSARTRDEALARFALPRQRRYVTLVANLHHAVKDHPTFLRAARRVRRAVADSAFLVAGEGELAASLRRMSDTLGLASDVHFLGPVDDIGDLLLLSEVCVLSSTAEGMSNSLLEYMAAGRPVVATDVGAATEVVVNGQTGWLVPAGDDAAMGARVVELLKDPVRASAMGARGKERVEEQFSPRAQVDRTLRLYDELVVPSTR